MSLQEQSLPIFGREEEFNNSIENPLPKPVAEILISPEPFLNRLRVGSNEFIAFGEYIDLNNLHNESESSSKSLQHESDNLYIQTTHADTLANIRDTTREVKRNMYSKKGYFPAFDETRTIKKELQGFYESQDTQSEGEIQPDKAIMLLTNLRNIVLRGGTYRTYKEQYFPEEIAKDKIIPSVRKAPIKGDRPLINESTNNPSWLKPLSYNLGDKI